MIVEGREVEWHQVPANEAKWIDIEHPYVTQGKVYDVAAVGVFEGTVFVLIIDDADVVSWKLGIMFSVIEPELPADWVVSIFHEEPRLAVGPPFIVESREAYASSIDDNTRAVRVWLRDRKLARESKQDQGAC